MTYIGQDNSHSPFSPAARVIPENYPAGYRHTTIFKDMTSSISGARVPPANAPASTNFGPASTPQRQEFAFDVGEFIYIQPFHPNHDIKPGGSAFPHVHWSTNGVSTNPVRWELTIIRAKGHNQAAFDAVTVVEIEQAGSGIAWQHMIAEAEVPLVMTEPDELIIMTLRRIAAVGGAANADTVFGLTVDLHYEAEYYGTPQKAPNFYDL